jgi:hypothetical protein
MSHWSLVWLNSSCTTASAVSQLRSASPTTNNVAGIGEIFCGPILITYCNAPGLPPNGDPRTPDILVTPDIGVTYSGSGKKLAEHSGFSRDDTNWQNKPLIPFYYCCAHIEPLDSSPTFRAPIPPQIAGKSDR